MYTYMYKLSCCVVPPLQVNASRASMVQSVGDFEKSLDGLREELSSTRGQYQQACQEMASLRDELTGSTHALEEKEQLLLTEVRISTCSWDIIIGTCMYSHV